MEKYEENLIWTKRFITAAIVQGAIIVGLTVFIILGEISIIKPGISRVIASGGGRHMVYFWLYNVHSGRGNWCCGIGTILFVS